MLVDGALVPVRHLINGGAIVQEPVTRCAYHHVESATHDVIVLAEELPCESYLDTGNHAAFVTDENVVATHAVASRGSSTRRKVGESYRIHIA